MNLSKEEMAEVVRKINLEARTNLEFRELCLTNPNKAIQQISNIEIPSGFIVRFIENEDAHYTHVLPDFEEGSYTELSDSELDQVAGGGGGRGFLDKRCVVCGSSDKTMYDNGKCEDCV